MNPNRRRIFPQRPANAGGRCLEQKDIRISLLRHRYRYRHIRNLFPLQEEEEGEETEKIAAPSTTEEEEETTTTTNMLRYQPGGRGSGPGPASAARSSRTFRTVGQSRRFQTGPFSTTGSSDSGHPGGGVSLLSAGNRDENDQDQGHLHNHINNNNRHNTNTIARQPDEMNQNGQQMKNGDSNEHKHKHKNENNNNNHRPRTPSTQLKGDAKPFVPHAAAAPSAATTVKTSSANTSPTSVVSPERNNDKQQQMTMVRAEKQVVPATTLSQPEAVMETALDSADVITPQKLMAMYLDTQLRRRAATVNTEEQQQRIMSHVKDQDNKAKFGHGRSATIGTSARDFHIEDVRPPLPGAVPHGVFTGAVTTTTTGSVATAGHYQEQQHQQMDDGMSLIDSSTQAEMHNIPRHHRLQFTPTRRNQNIRIQRESQALAQSHQTHNGDVPGHHNNEMAINTPSSQRSGRSHVPHPYFQYQSPNTHAVVRQDGGERINAHAYAQAEARALNQAAQSQGQMVSCVPVQQQEQQVAPLSIDGVDEKWAMMYDVRRYKFHPKNRLQKPVEPFDPSFFQHESCPADVTGQLMSPRHIVVSEEMQQYRDALHKYDRQQEEIKLYEIECGLADKESGVIVPPLKFDAATPKVVASRSEELQALTENGRPNLNDVLDPDFLPFVSCFSHSFPAETNGVVVLKNVSLTTLSILSYLDDTFQRLTFIPNQIPYETTRGECIALLGKNSRILSDANEPVHIIMDRVTSKTMDAFCELSSMNAAVELVDKFRKGNETGRVARLGNRVVDVELASQSALMLALFPNTARGVVWKGATPRPVEDAEHSWNNFKGFITDEEMSMLSKHVEAPQRASFARICPERPYECMISTLRKMPWYMASHITIKQRQSVYECTMKMMRVLAMKLEQVGSGIMDHLKQDDERLTPQLFNRLVTSAMLCPGFSVAQKHNIAVLAGLEEGKARGFNQPRFPDGWRHQWTLAPKPGVPLDVLEWYIAIIREETNRVVQNLNISQRMPLQKLLKETDAYWGYFWAEVNLPLGPKFDKMTLHECNEREWQAVEKILTRAIQGGAIPFSYTTRSNFLAGPKRAAHRRITMTQS
ncbi:hypothetical protein F5Y17DRAFT_221286 [Xylariaceae sp. FL0594]|nr:hypothetical protein F5Y17DRAFT_221286 [Xylariaceae sp. FL0594]